MGDEFLALESVRGGVLDPGRLPSACTARNDRDASDSGATDLGVRLPAMVALVPDRGALDATQGDNGEEDEPIVNLLRNSRR